MTTGNADDPEPTGDVAPTPPVRPSRMSARMSYLLIGGIALGGIVLMCLVVLMLALAL